LENSRKNSNPFQEEKNVEINEQKNVNEKPSNFNNQESSTLFLFQFILDNFVITFFYLI